MNLLKEGRRVGRACQEIEESCPSILGEGTRRSQLPGSAVVSGLLLLLLATRLFAFWIPPSSSLGFPGETLYKAKTFRFRFPRASNLLAAVELYVDHQRPLFEDIRCAIEQ